MLTIVKTDLMIVTTGTSLVLKSVQNKCRKKVVFHEIGTQISIFFPFLYML